MTAHTQIAFCRVGDYSSGVPVEAVHVREVSGGADGNGSLLPTQTFAPTGSNQVSLGACPSNMRYCRIATDTAVLISFGSAPNALTDAGALFVPAGAKEFFMVSPGDKVSAVAAS